MNGEWCQEWESSGTDTSEQTMEVQSSCTRCPLSRWLPPRAFDQSTLLPADLLIINLSLFLHQKRIFHFLLLLESGIKWIWFQSLTMKVWQGFVRGEELDFCSFSHSHELNKLRPGKGMSINESVIQSLYHVYRRLVQGISSW